MLQCPNCKKSPATEDELYCAECGVPMVEVQPEVQPQPVYQPAPQASQNPEDALPEQYKPLGAWSYFGLSLLFNVPIVGFVFLIVFSFKRSNINRRNFARSYWCWLLILGVIVLVAVLFGILLGRALVPGFGSEVGY